MEKPIQPWKKILAASAWLLAGWSAGAQVVITNVATVNVTPSGFSVAAVILPPPSSTTNLTFSVFSDAGGKTNLAGQVGMEFYPLNSGDPTTTNNFQSLQSRAALRQDSLALGLFYARVSSCLPGATYYYQIRVTGTNGQSAAWPPTGPLPSVTTARDTSFVVDSQQLLITLSDAGSPGSIITLSTSNTPSALAAVVGDGAGPNQVFFSVNDLIAAVGGTNFAPLGAQLFTAEVLGSPSSGQSETYSLTFADTFSVGQAANLGLGAVASTITLGTGAMLVGESASIPITLTSQGTIIGFSFTLSIPSDVFTAVSMQPTDPALKSASLTALSSNLVQLSFAAASGENFQGSQQVGVLNVTATSNQPSAFVPLWPTSPQATNANVGATNLFTIQPGLAVIIGANPLLQMQLTAGAPELILYGIPGDSYQIQSSATLNHAALWSDFLTVPMTNLSFVISDLNPTPAAFFFRAYGTTKQ